jgi:hypothetical protein
MGIAAGQLHDEGVLHQGRVLSCGIGLATEMP